MIEDDRLPLKEKYLEYYRALPIQKLAAEFIHRSADTIQNWAKEDDDFSAQVDLAKTEWARENAKKVKSREWLLERVMNEHFKEHKQVDVNIPTPLLGEDDVQKDNSPKETTATE